MLYAGAKYERTTGGIWQPLTKSSRLMLVHTALQRHNMNKLRHSRCARAYRQGKKRIFYLRWPFGFRMPARPEGRDSASTVAGDFASFIVNFPHKGTGPPLGFMPLLRMQVWLGVFYPSETQQNGTSTGVPLYRVFFVSPSDCCS